MKTGIKNFIESPEHKEKLIVIPTPLRARKSHFTMNLIIDLKLKKIKENE